MNKEVVAMFKNGHKAVYTTHVLDLLLDDPEAAVVYDRATGARLHCAPGVTAEIPAEDLKLNSMCLNCDRLHGACEGTQKYMWSGCVYFKHGE